MDPSSLIFSCLFSTVIGLIFVYLIFRKPCKHQWVLLHELTETQTYIGSSKQDQTINKVYTCTLCGKIKTFRY